MNKSLEKNKNIMIGVAILLAVVLLLIIISPFKIKETSTTQTGTQPPGQNIQKTTVPETDVTQTDVNKIFYSDSKLCENYVLAQGEEVTIDGRKISVTKIGPTSIRLTINGQDAILSEGAYTFKDEIRVELLTKKILYFGNDDEDNSVELKIGCNNNEDPTEKHIIATLKKRGENICAALIKTCESEFDLR